MNKNILLISYVFPPSKEVGGRRWGKFAKAMTNQGYKVDLITFSNENMEIPLSYVSSRTILRNRFPKVLNKYPISILNKIKYRLALFKVKRSTKGNFYDKGIFCEKELYRVLKTKLADKSYEKVIVTGGPFSLLYYLSNWKQEFGYNLVSDIRDPWTMGDSYGIKNLSASRLAEEKRREKMVLSESDIVSVPGVIMRQDFEKEYPNYYSKVLVMPHGYSEKEFSTVAKRNKDKRKKWIYGGTLYPESFENYKEVFDFVEGNEPQLRLDIYSRGTALNFREYKGVQFMSLISPQAFNVVCQEADAFIWFFPEKFKDFFTTKLYELIRCRIPIIYIGYQGQFSEFIVGNRLGVFIEARQLAQDIHSVSVAISQLNYNMDFPIEQYSTDNIIKSIL